VAERWPAALAEIDRVAPVGSILHIGAGAGADVPAYRATAAAQILLVEPHPDVLPFLERQARQDARVRVLPVAVAAATGKATLHRFNFPSLSSLQTPLAKQTLFPGLRRIASSTVTTLSVANLLDQAGLDVVALNILVVDAPGTERQIVADLLAGAWAAAFAHVILRAAPHLYEGAAPLPELVALLEKGGYRVAATAAEDPDFPEVRLRLEPLVLENRRLRAALEAAAREKETAAPPPKESSEMLERIAALEDALVEEEARRRSLEVEVVRAEAQMEIIRAFMTREGERA
jgi:FkbM family methyltransferase